MARYKFYMMMMMMMMHSFRTGGKEQCGTPIQQTGKGSRQRMGRPVSEALSLAHVEEPRAN